ncbi:MAG: TRAP transporter small permease subunit [Rubritepida sp.]|nr:TRAP transporter small permease subunit [Rubritepida sp.]
MQPLLAFSAAVDWVSTRFGRVADWMVLLACVVSAGNAIIRYLFSNSSNAWLELQWYFFAGMVLLGASYTLLRNEHVRVDLLYGWVGHRTRLYIDIFGFIFFVLPAMCLMLYMTWPFFMDSWMRNEGSPNAGGLLRWPVKFILPLGFALVVLQGFSELIKRIAVLRGVPVRGNAFLEYHKPEQ